MNLALSNFAWDNDESKVIFKTLKNNDINNIECVLTKIKPWNDLTIDDIKNYKKELKKHILFNHYFIMLILTIYVILKRIYLILKD